MQTLVATIVLGITAVALDPEWVVAFHTALEATIPEPWTLVVIPVVISVGAGVAKYATDWATRTFFLSWKRKP